MSGSAITRASFRLWALCAAAGGPPTDPATPPADTTAPDTTITSGPTGTVASASADFTFSSPEAGTTFECRIDGGAWGACTSPSSYANLANGSHTFDVRAIDAALNTDATPATQTWTVSV